MVNKKFGLFVGLLLICLLSLSEEFMVHKGMAPQLH